MNLEFRELDLDWPFEISIFDLRSYVLTELMNYGEPLRWAITSVTDHPEKETQIMLVEAVLIVKRDESKGINYELN